MAGVSHKPSGGFKKGDSIVVDGAACTVTSISVSRPGKHGHAKVRIEAVGMIDKKKRQLVAPGHDDIEVPIIDKRNAQVLNITKADADSDAPDVANVMDTESYETFDLNIPDEIKDQVEEGKEILYWCILNDKVMKQVKNV